MKNKNDDLEAENLHQVDIKCESSGQRIDRALSEAIPDLSRSRIKMLILAGEVTSNGATIIDPSKSVKQGDLITVKVPPPVPAYPEAQSIPLDIVFEDEHLIVINKQAGLVVHPGAGNPDGTLVNALLAHCGESLAGIGGVARPGIVHRIDKDTSGLLVVAKTEKTHNALSSQFKDHSADRQYEALVWGKVPRKKGTITGPIGRASHQRTKMAVVKTGGRDAITHYEVTHYFGPKSKPVFSQVNCTLETGRTHQVRVHMAHIGHPLVGDPLYGKGRLLPTNALSETAKQAFGRFSRQALHAKRLAFVHPVTNEQMCYSVEKPQDFTDLLTLISEEFGSTPL